MSYEILQETTESTPMYDYFNIYFGPPNEEKTVAYAKIQRLIVKFRMLHKILIKLISQLEILVEDLIPR